MAGLFQNYRIALLDASFFVGSFSQQVQEGLQEVNIYVADTFNAEIEQHRAVLSSGKRTVYEENIAFLNRGKQLKTLNFASFGDQSKNIHNDTWGVLTLLVSLNAKFVLVTADQILIQRVILHNLNVDIYDLNENAFVYFSNFAAYRRRFELCDSGPSAADVDVHVAEHAVLYRKNGAPVVLGKEIKSGMEAHLHFVEGSPNLIAKIFKKDKLSVSKYKNILRTQNINRILEIPWALFPMDMVYHDAACTIPAGFTESYARTKGNVDDNPLYLGDLDLPDVYLNTHLSASLELCLKVVRQVHYLNSYGFLVSDFNMGNFALVQDNSECIQMWDTDSFGYENFFSGYCAGNQTSREYDITKKDGAIDFCSEALYLFAFSVLSLGDAPISEFSGKFKFDNPNYGALYRKELFPGNLWKLFEQVFRGEKPASVEVLLQQLHMALYQCKTNDPTYKELLDRIFGVPAPTSGGAIADKPGHTTTAQPAGSTGGETMYVPPKEEKRGMPTWLKVLLIVAGALLSMFIFVKCVQSL